MGGLPGPLRCCLFLNRPTSSVWLSVAEETCSVLLSLQPLGMLPGRSVVGPRRPLSRGRGCRGSLHHGQLKPEGVRLPRHREDVSIVGRWLAFRCKILGGKLAPGAAASSALSGVGILLPGDRCGSPGARAYTTLFLALCLRTVTGEFQWGQLDVRLGPRGALCWSRANALNVGGPFAFGACHV
jgi:hypothetical protein